MIDPPACRDAPRCVVDERRHPFDDVPLPAEREPSKDVQVVADERLPVEDDREEVHGEVRGAASLA